MAVTCGQGWHPGEISMAKPGGELPQPLFAYELTTTVFPTAGREATHTQTIQPTSWKYLLKDFEEKGF